MAAVGIVVRRPPSAMRDIDLVTHEALEQQRRWLNELAAAERDLKRPMSPAARDSVLERRHHAATMLASARRDLDRVLLEDV
jgi:hypothetical protein